MKLDNIIQNIRKQQLECFEYIDILSEDEIKSLLIDGKYFYFEKDNEILASYYLKLLTSNPKIYRLGGLSVLNIRDTSFTTKRAVVELFVNLQVYILNQNIAFITRTDTLSLGTSLIHLGGKRVSFEECTIQYPLFLKSWLDDSIRTKEYCKSKTFYVREGNGE